MDTSKQAQDASQGNQQGQHRQGQQVARGSIEGQQGNLQQGGAEQGSMQQGAMQGATQGSPQQGSMQGAQEQGAPQQGSQQGSMQPGLMHEGAEGMGAQTGSAVQRRQDANIGVLRPPVDVIEDAGGITLLADLPGVSKENLNLRLEAQSLTIEGAMSLDLPADMEPRHAEVRHQHYERTFALSRELNGEEATAELHHGVLKIRIPKSQDAMPRKIPVNPG